MPFKTNFIFLSLTAGLMASEGFAKPDRPRVSEDAWARTATRAIPIPRRTHMDIRIPNLLNETDLEVNPTTLHLIAREPFQHGFVGNPGHPWKIRSEPYEVRARKN